MAALSRFISRLGEKGLPFFKLRKASEKFSWIEEADTAFTQLKTFATSPPVLTAPQPNEDLLLYMQQLIGSFPRCLWSSGMNQATSTKSRDQYTS
jgi:hypothetical protein